MLRSGNTKKHEGKFTVPFDESPKLYITTNHALNGEGSSYRVDVKTDSDKGAAMVELRVAPSLPLSFLLVTLRAKGGGLLVEERA